MESYNIYVVYCLCYAKTSIWLYLNKSFLGFAFTKQFINLSIILLCYIIHWRTKVWCEVMKENYILIIYEWQHWYNLFLNIEAEIDSTNSVSRIKRSVMSAGRYQKPSLYIFYNTDRSILYLIISVTIRHNCLILTCTDEGQSALVLAAQKVISLVGIVLRLVFNYITLVVL